ncbi:hypothetical protein BLNAU_1844 [Blattamonas nauphoetae]|uniref:CDAN1-interacting nuclease 1 n=1 Tax=Blattamonas nauphoetae TaxID=2049346 RepID=A0ABQ9YHT0_9EUKA|nr:hypothetical protein BLNAU_1844 [Blattamonas nauphoetae]
MKYQLFLFLASNLRSHRDIALYSQMFGIPTNVLASMLSQINVNRIIKYCHSFLKNLQKHYKSLTSADQITTLSQDAHLPQEYLVEQFLGHYIEKLPRDSLSNGKLKPLSNADKKTIKTNLCTNPELIENEALRALVKRFLTERVTEGITDDQVRRALGQLHEFYLFHSIDLLGLGYFTEEGCRMLDYDKTPDVLLKQPFLFNWKKTTQSRQFEPVQLSIPFQTVYTPNQIVKKCKEFVGEIQDEEKQQEYSGCIQTIEKYEAKQQRYQPEETGIDVIADNVRRYREFLLKEDTFQPFSTSPLLIHPSSSIDDVPMNRDSFMQTLLSLSAGTDPCFLPNPFISSEPDIQTPAHPLLSPSHTSIPRPSLPPSLKRADMQKVCWIDSKASFSEPLTTFKKTLPQLISYTHRFGPGMVLFFYDYIDELNEYLEMIGHGDIVCVNVFPNFADIQVLDEELVYD